MTKYKKWYIPANVLLACGTILLIIGYFLWTMLIPIQDIDMMSREEIIKLQKEVAINYPLGQGLMFLGGMGMLSSIPLYIYVIISYLISYLCDKFTA